MSTWLPSLRVVRTRGEGGLSVFVRDGDRVFHSYSAYQRGLDLLLNTYNSSI